MEEKKTMTSSSITSGEQAVKLEHVKLGYRYALRPWLRPLSLLVVLLALLEACNQLCQPQWDKQRLVPVLACTAALLLLFYLVFLRQPKVYLVDFACFKPHERFKCSMEMVDDFCARSGNFTPESLAFQKKVVLQSGLGPETHAPAFVFGDEGTEPSLAQSRREAEEVMFGAIDELLLKSGVDASEVEVLVVNCSLFSPTPSLSSMIVNRYKLRSDIRSFNLSGMGCSASLVAIDLAAQLLRSLGRRSSYALVVSTEDISHNWYIGNDRSMLVTNCLFRVGGAAVLISTSSSSTSKYELLHGGCVRTHTGAEDAAYACVQQREDDCGLRGVSLDKRLMAVAGDALRANITRLAPLVLPLSEQVRYARSLVSRKLRRILRLKASSSSLYTPDFRKAFEHVCIHAGGRGVLDEMEKRLRLSGWHMEPSRMTLHRFGNTSSSSIWYELAYAEAKGRVRRGHRVWQVAFGSGFKCNSAVWRATRHIPPPERHNPWLDCIASYPVSR